jgi:hypothetical protein
MSAERNWYDADISALANIVARWVVKNGSNLQDPNKNCIYMHIYTHIHTCADSACMYIYKIICSSISKQANMNWIEPMYWGWGGYKGLPRNWVHHAILQIGCQIKLIFTKPMKVLQKKKRASCSGVNLHANTHNIYVHIKPLKSIFDPAQESQQTCRTKNSICTKSSDTRTNGIYAHIAHIMLTIIYNTCTCTEKTSVHSSKSS